MPAMAIYHMCSKPRKGCQHSNEGPTKSDTPLTSHLSQEERATCPPRPCAGPPPAPQWLLKLEFTTHKNLFVAGVAPQPGRRATCPPRPCTAHPPAPAAARSAPSPRPAAHPAALTAWGTPPGSGAPPRGCSRCPTSGCMRRKLHCLYRSLVIIGFKRASVAGRQWCAGSFARMQVKHSRRCERSAVPTCIAGSILGAPMGP